jgi:DNA-binding NarL/FixJ family response regulator
MHDAASGTTTTDMRSPVPNGSGPVAHWVLERMATRILIVEDEPIVALNYASILEDAGCDVIGPANTAEKGIGLISRERLDGAVLDIDLGGVPVDPIIEALEERAVPYIFVSAYRDRSAPYKNVVFLEKPCTAFELIKAVNALVLPARRDFEDFDSQEWDPATLAHLRQAVADASAMYQLELGDQSDEGATALNDATKAVADLARAGVRDGERLAHYARLAIENSLASARTNLPQSTD